VRRAESRRQRAESGEEKAVGPGHDDGLECTPSDLGEAQVLISQLDGLYGGGLVCAIMFSAF
jgi:hypothetical protein